MKQVLTLIGMLAFVIPVSAQEVGLQLYSLRNQFKEDVPRTLKIIKGWGITKIEGGGTYGLSMEDFKKMLTENNLDVVSVGAGFGDLENNVDKVIENARAFDAKYVMCAWVPHDDNKWDLEETEHASKVFNKAGKKLKEHGLILAYHPHGYEFRPWKDGTLFDYMAQNATDYTFELDVFWAHHGGADPLALMKKYPDKFTLMHLKDMEHGVKGNNTGHEDVETNVILGQGQVNIAGTVAEAKKLGIEYMFIEDESSRVVEQVPASLKYLKSLDEPKIGLQLYSLRNVFPTDVSGTFAKIKSWGIHNLEDGNDGTYGYTMEKYKAMLAKNDLKIVSVSAPFEELQDSPETVIKRAKEYGAKYAVCFWIPHKDTIFTIKETKLALDVFNKAGKKLKDEGITLAYHPHGYEFRPYEGELLMDYMIKNSDYFDFEMDVYWFAHPGEDPVAWLRKYPKEFKLMHIKDCKKGVKGNHNGKSDVETNVVLGTGQIDIAAIVKEAKKMDIDYIFIEDESSRSEEQIPQSFGYLEDLDK
ncbi:sugar phosphate isomerase/epimerase family protein [Ulvibacterium sp.]|uniref:sugar phosphate isomerase/epimerase family protein n=1 Tax=Ulvibacterium sp. TaxID=2665914 RepID=UPI003BABECA7